jgi:hypothetical protein
MRNTLLIGSLPFENEEVAMRHAMQQLGETMLCVPDGEIGEKTPEFPNGKRSAWVMVAINICTADTENWELISKGETDASGFPVDYNDVQKLKPKRSPGEMHNHIRFGYDEYFKQSYPIFQRLREEYGLPNLKFQVGIPTGLGIAFTMMRPLDAFRYADAMNKRLAYEVNEIVKIAGDDVVIQIELPAEIALAYRMPSFLMGIAVSQTLNLVKKIDPNAILGLHLCLGDLNNKALTSAKSLQKMVAFSNKLMSKWTQHRLLYVHYPLAEAALPPTLEPDYYAPLKDVVLPAGTHMVAGFVHDKRTEEENEAIRNAIESHRGSSVAVACSCGLGRRTQPIAEELIAKMRLLTQP